MFDEIGQPSPHTWNLSRSIGMGEYAVKIRPGKEFMLFGEHTRLASSSNISLLQTL